MDVGVFLFQYVIGTIAVTGNGTGETGIPIECTEMVRFPGQLKAEDDDRMVRIQF